MFRITFASSSGRVVPRTVGPIFPPNSTLGTQPVFRLTLLSRLAATEAGFPAPGAKLESHMPVETRKAGNP